MIIFIKYLVGFLLLLLILGLARTWQVRSSSNQDLFIKGTLPNPAPNGLYHGTVPGHKVSWLGKKFNSGTQTGINLFDEGDGKTSEKYPFKTSATKGVWDEKIEVLSIDYNIDSNPFWLRLILDEVVEIAPNQFLGKLQLRIIPNLPFTLGFFELKK